MAEKADAEVLTGSGHADVEGATRELVERVLKEPKIPTMGKKLIVEASVPGHYPGLLWEHFGIMDMPPPSIEEQTALIVECAKAGAAAVHTHPREPNVSSRFLAAGTKRFSAELLANLLDRVYQEVDVVPLGHAWHPKDWQDLAEADYITPAREILEVGEGNKYMQGGVVMTTGGPASRRGNLSSWHSANSLKDGIAYLEEHSVKPLVALHMEHFAWFKENVMDAGVLKTRPHFNIQDGKHGVDMCFADPMSHINLISSVEMVKRTVPDCTIGLHAGGRNWLPMTVLAIMLGVDLVRVGIEDQFWACPHKDEFIRKPVEAVAKVVTIARALGRDIATAGEAREILGIKRT